MAIKCTYLGQVNPSQLVFNQLAKFLKKRLAERFHYGILQTSARQYGRKELKVLRLLHSVANRGFGCPHRLCPPT